MGNISTLVYICLGLATLTACQTAPTKAPMVVNRTVERYVPIDPALTAPCAVAAVRQPSEIAAVAAARKRALLDYNRRLGEIATLQGSLSEDKGQAGKAEQGKFPQ